MFRVQRMGLIVALAVGAAPAMPGPAPAMSINGQQMMRNWSQSDRCVAQAQKQFPDWSAEALAQRDTALQQCLSSGVLPPRAPEAPQGPRQ